MIGLVGIPHVKRGRSIDGADCWGIVFLAHEDAGIQLSEYGDISPDELLKVAREMRKSYDQSPWIDVTSEPRRELDVVLMAQKPGAEISHVGVMVNETHVVHSMRTADSVKVALSHHSVKSLIRGFRRHEALK